MKNLVVANWKMNKTRPQALEFREKFARQIGELSGVEVSLAPPFPFLANLTDSEGRWSLAGQNCSAEKSGAFTGEVSAAMLASCGCRYVIIGHSERRRYFHENEVLLGFKMERAREAGIVPIYCVGETLRQRQEGLAHQVLARQIEALASDPGDKPLVVAYEPVWAIGTGYCARPEEARETIVQIRQLLGPRGEAVRVLYGGSVTAENAGDFAKESPISGFLVGGASLDPVSFARICAEAIP